MIYLNNKPVIKTEMLIKRPVHEVFEAFINPEVTTKFWFSKSSGRLEAGKYIRWDWEIYGVWDEVFVRDIVENKLIVIESSDGTTVEWLFTRRSDEHTLVTITNQGFTGNGDDIVSQAVDAMGGYTMVLCGLKALLEHNVILNLVADKSPDAHVID